MHSVLRQVAGHVAAESLEALFPSCSKHKFQIRLWDGSAWGETEDPRFVLHVRNPRALQRMFESPDELSLGEAHVLGDLDIEGDIQAAVKVGDYLLAHPARCFR